MDDIQEEYVKVGEHSYKLPPKPPKKEIFFHNLPKAEQYWKRAELIKDFPSFFFDWERGVEENAKITKYEGKRLVSISPEDTERLKQLRDREIIRMQTGVWFYNKGVPTYLTGGHYGVLMWAAMDDCMNEVEPGSEYGGFYYFQCIYAYFIEICKVTPVACGGNCVKPKKTGLTMFQELLILIDAITHRSANYRIMSTKEDVATKVNMKYVLYASRRLPEILKPEYRNNLSAIYFEDTGKGSKGGGKNKSDVEHLETIIETVATVWNSFDSGKNRVAHVDEQSKIKLDKKNTLITLHNNVIATVMQGFIRIGYVIYTHYVSDTNDKSYREAKVIYYESKLKTINTATGTTKSGLICLALTINDGVFGGCDVYGMPHKERIHRIVNGEMEKRKDDPAALRSYRRQMPQTEDDCWSESAGEASLFDNMRLGIKLHQLVEDQSTAVFPYTDFNFQWTIPPEIDEVRNIINFKGVPYMVPVADDEKRKGKDHGLWKWYQPEWTPNDFLRQHINKHSKDKKGRIKPNDGCPFYCAIDPTQYSGAQDVVVGSKNAIQVFMIPNAELDARLGKKVSDKRLVVEYLHRADNPRDTLMHVIQTIMYFGCYVLIECNANWLATRLKELGFANFLIVVNKETGILEPYSEYREQKPFTSQKSDRGASDTIGEYVAAGMMHLNNEFSNSIEVLDSISIITDLMNFDTDNTKEFDAGVCYLIGLLGINTYMGWKQQQMDKAGSNHGGSLRQVMGVLAK